MEYNKYGRKGKLFNLYEDVMEGTIRLINDKLYYCCKQIFGGYGFKKTIWAPLDLSKILGYKVICDETNNSEKDKKEMKLNVDIHLNFKHLRR